MRQLLQLLLTISLMILLSACGGGGGSSSSSDTTTENSSSSISSTTETSSVKEPITNINPSEIEGLHNKGIPLFDIRTEAEWIETGVISYANTVTYYSGSTFAAKLEELGFSKDDPFMLICRSGNRSSNLSTELMLLGYTNIYNVTSGMSTYISLGYEVVEYTP